MRKIIEFIKEDFQKSYVDIEDCPIAAAMKRAGVPFTNVGPGFWRNDYEMHTFSKTLRKIDGRLSNGYEVRYRDGIKINAYPKALVKSLVGRRVVVQW